MSKPRNQEFEFLGVNHLALVCKDMAKTVTFYRDVLGMPLIKTIDLPAGKGQHFFFDVGNGDAIAFFWFPDAPQAAPGIAAPENLPTRGNIRSAHGSMNHIAINVPAERFDEYYAKLKAKGVDVTEIFNHDNSPTQMSKELTKDVFVRSVYFFDPDGICLELAAWTREFDDSDVRHAPVRADGTPDLSVLQPS
ncbi:VOC family protein [Hyphomonas sp. NPDC076900]|uniref:VOC family protein n=1 Tax=unclassified Hyphomonas TaxID=2630699 RepID=UPI003CFE9415